MRHVRDVMRPAIRRVARRQLAPLEPDAFLVWAWRQGDRDPGTQPLTLDDVLFETRLPLAELRRDYVRLAARVRRNQRLGIEPFEGIA